jgi:beta-1,2-mannobiose phosphorylase / 1,2-beta-oligomannan phosphorylase
VKLVSLPGSPRAERDARLIARVGLAGFFVMAVLLGSIYIPTFLVPHTAGGWIKDPDGPSIGVGLGTCFDLSVMHDRALYKAWFSWRDKNSIAYTQSPDGINWSAPTIVLGPTNSGWEETVNRPTVIETTGGYAMWYTGQTSRSSAIGYAVSADGISWTRVSADPVLVANRSWEKQAVMNPDVLYDRKTGLFRMWYSAGEQYEPDAVGYATSRDGTYWTKDIGNPIFRGSGTGNWDAAKTTAVDVEPYGTGGTGFVMFYVGFPDETHAQIGIAYSPDGIRNWTRSAANPIIRPGNALAWDSDAVYKPAVIHESGGWLLWYNGRRGTTEQVGRAIHEGDTLSP